MSFPVKKNIVDVDSQLSENLWSRQLLLTFTFAWQETYASCGTYKFGW